MPEKLSEWRLLRIDGAFLVPNDRVLPYDLNTPLFSDYAHKLRTVWMPEGSVVVVDELGEPDFPVGTVFSKTFYYPVEAASAEEASPRLQVVREEAPFTHLENGALALGGLRLIETRLLVRRENGWFAFPYVWNEKQSEATLSLTGSVSLMELVDADLAPAGGEGGAVGVGVAGATPQREPFVYVVPDVNQCTGCHATNHTDKKIRPIGPKWRHLEKSFDGEPQLARWAALGYLPPGEPQPHEANAVSGDSRSGTLEERARAYLDVNCGHCHNPVGPADTSGLFLDKPTTNGRRLGVCKPPVAAGRGSGDRLVSIDPGHPERSILPFRMDSTDPGIAMPELGRSTVHREGVALITEWIRSLEGDCGSALQESPAGMTVGG